MLLFRDFTNSDFAAVNQLLEDISHVSNPTCEENDSPPHHYQRIVGMLDGKVVCFGQITYSKRVRGGLSAYIEDIVVAREFRSQGLGSLLVNELLSQAKHRKAYKATLTCKKELLSFYSRCDFTVKGIHLDAYL